MVTSMYEEDERIWVLYDYFSINGGTFENHNACEYCNGEKGPEDIFNPLDKECYIPAEETSKDFYQALKEIRGYRLVE